MARGLLNLRRMRFWWTLALPLVACAAVPDSDPQPDPDQDPQPDPDPDPQPDPAAPVIDYCVGRSFTAPASEEWQHWTSDAVVLAGEPRHYAQDLIVAPGAVETITTKFASGAVWKDLEGERIAVFVDDCAGWRDLGTFTTDDDGEIDVPMPSDLAIGQHEVRAVVVGDGTQAITSQWVLPRGTHVVVTDVDGTMTTSDTELFQELYDGDYVPVEFPGAQDLTHAHTERGHVVVYLTGRPYWLLGITRAWLDGQGFAPGPVHVAPTNAEALPTEGGVGTFKATYLAGLTAKGYVVDLAYGNASTDIYAYAANDLDAWIIGEHAGEQGTHAVDASWEARAAEVASGPIVGQPY